jgi:AcrR family transcriptional regulator
MVGNVKTRKYDSAIRAQQKSETAARIAVAAADIFARKGYARARMEEIAARSGTAVATIYKIYGNKARVLEAATRIAMTGDHAGRLEDQSWWLEQLQEADPRTQLSLVARNARMIGERAGSLLDAVRAAGSGDDGQLAGLWKNVNDERLVRSRRTARALAAKGRLRKGVDQRGCTVILWLLTAPELYVLLVNEARMTPKAYEKRLADLLSAALLPP